MGQRLFEALFADDVRLLYVASRQRARESSSVLRLVLRVRPAELARLPWEFLWDPGQQDYLGLTVPLVRYPQVLAALQPLRVTVPLRILGMVASPDDLPALDAGEERRRLQNALEGLERKGLVELGWVPGQTYRDLEVALSSPPWHVLHFIGHGGYDRTADEGTLALADETGHTHSVGADDISRLLGEHYPLRLVVLNACDTGRGSAADTFSSTAAALIRREVPAVVAMQFEISDWAAIQFAQNFYQYVAERRPVDDSVMRARRAMRMARNGTLEWGTSVLYLRALDGRIFDATAPPAPQPGTYSDPIRTPEGPAASPTSAHQGLADPPAPPPAPSRAVRDLNAVQILRHREGVTAVAFSPDGRRLATAGGDRAARVWDVGSGKQLTRVTHNGWVLGVAFSPDGRRLATASDDNTTRVWDGDSRQKPLRLVHNGWVRAVAFSPDGRRLATASDDKTARVWDAGSGQELTRITHDGQVRGVAFSPDGRRLATASDDKTARVWDAGSGEQLVRVTHEGWVEGVRFSPDGYRLATAGSDGSARVWDAGSGQELARVTHNSVVRGVGFSLDGCWLATVSDDKTARVWDVGSGQELARATHSSVVRGVEFSPDGRRLATASDGGTARIWVLSGDE